MITAFLRVYYSPTTSITITVTSHHLPHLHTPQLLSNAKHTHTLTYTWLRSHSFGFSFFHFGFVSVPIYLYALAKFMQIIPGHICSMNHSNFLSSLSHWTKIIMIITMMNTNVYIESEATENESIPSFIRHSIFSPCVGVWWKRLCEAREGKVEWGPVHYTRFAKFCMLFHRIFFVEIDRKHPLSSLFLSASPSMCVFFYASRNWSIL